MKVEKVVVTPLTASTGPSAPAMARHEVPVDGRRVKTFGSARRVPAPEASQR